MKVDIRRIGQDPLVVEVDDDIAGAVYITINGRVYYIDDSTNEQIVKRWPECSCMRQRLNRGRGFCYCPDDEVEDLVPENEASFATDVLSPNG